MVLLRYYADLGVQLNLFNRFLKRPAAVSEAIFFDGDYSNYEEALQHCGGSSGYASNDAIEHYIRRYKVVSADPAKAIANASEQVLRFMSAFSLAEPIDGVFRVYDLGGGYGAIYELFRHLYPHNRFEWTVVELPELVQRASEMGASAEKLFSSEIPEGPFSLGISSGTLQYLPDPAKGISQMLSAQARVTMLNRVPLWERADRLTVQHVPEAYFKASFPAWFLSRRWTEKFDLLGERLIEWNSPGDTVRIDDVTVAYGAFLYRSSS